MALNRYRSYEESPCRVLGLIVLTSQTVESYITFMAVTLHLGMISVGTDFEVNILKKHERPPIRNVNCGRDIITENFTMTFSNTFPILCYGQTC